MKTNLLLFTLLLALLVSCSKSDDNQNNPPANTGTVKDYEGNTYSTITIGTQTWMTENLRSEKYNDGTDIQLVTDSIAWPDTKTGAYCYYHNNESAYKTSYGALYNWYAVESGKLAPAGWHVPTQADWQTLLDYLAAKGYNYDGTTISNKVAVSMAVYDGWFYSTGMGCVGNDDYKSLHNKSGFSAKPAGYRMPILYPLFSYCFSQMRTSWWTSDPVEGGGGAYMVYLSNDNPVVTITAQFNAAGASIRCVKD